MEGKEGKEYKPNSLYQIMRRLGFFPTMRSSRAGVCVCACVCVVCVYVNVLCGVCVGMGMCVRMCLCLGA